MWKKQDIVIGQPALKQAVFAFLDRLSPRFFAVHPTLLAGLSSCAVGVRLAVRETKQNAGVCAWLGVEALGFLRAFEPQPG
ncbi:hypothetical protein EF096_08245 [Pseudomonas neustonica]|uniref:Uncharacterized protein n=1 Tax=Pseudomonas neustonica TaxID=2487346 RepID=A0ABX9XLP8_9PSED|nr:hypothetical protein EF099_09385 [Pseudomonas sp. SSM44]ROZ85416.1 hypothetical protein EF096_08245 [Pseudomonas neustonica]